MIIWDTLMSLCDVTLRISLKIFLLKLASPPTCVLVVVTSSGSLEEKVWCLQLLYTSTHFCTDSSSQAVIGTSGTDALNMDTANEAEDKDSSLPV